MSSQDSHAAGEVASDAVRAFEGAIQRLQARSYDSAAAALREIIVRFPAERSLVERARVYLDLCDRERRRRSSEPESVEQRLTAATAALNRDDDVRAAALVDEVLAVEPGQDLALYLSAAIRARRGELDGALDLLERAVAANREAGVQARWDPDFEPLQTIERFIVLTDVAAAAGSSAHPRRARSGR